jgi:hypothetical protein
MSFSLPVACRLRRQTLVRDHSGPAACLLLALLAAPVRSAMAQEAAGAPSLEVVGTLFQVTTADQRVVTSPELVGAILDVADEEGRIMRVRIDAVTRDSSDADGEIWLHRFSVLDAGSGNWHELCTPGPFETYAMQFLVRSNTCSANRGPLGNVCAIRTLHTVIDVAGMRSAYG